MAKLFNRAKMTTTTTGSGTITLGSASNGFQSFADAGVADGDVVQYVIEEGANFEIGTGTYSATGTSLTRTPSESSNSDNAITLAGQATVSITAVADDLNRLQHNGTDKVTVSSTGASVSGNLAVSGTVDGVDVSARDAVLTSTTTTANAALPKAGGTVTGDLSLDGWVYHDVAGQNFVLRSDTSNRNTFEWQQGTTRIWTLDLQADGDLNFVDAQGGNTLRVGNSRIFADNYHPNADKWTTSRTLSLTGGVTGSVSWDGSANASLTSTVALATASAVGGIKIGYSENGKNYPVELDGSGKAYVNVPWTDTNTDTNTTYSLKAQQTGGNNTNPNLLLDANSGTDDTVQLVGSGATTVTRNSDGQITISSTDTNTNTNQLTTFQLEDGDGTEVTIGHGKEVKFVEAGGININWTDTSTGSDGDPYDLSFNVTSAPFLTEDDTVTYGTSGLQWFDINGNGGPNGNNATPSNPTNDWYHHILANHANGGGYYVDIAQSFHSDAVYHRRLTNGSLSSWHRFFTDVYHPNADKWTTARTHTVTLTGQVTGTASQNVDGTGNKTWSIATTLNDSALDDQYVTVGSRHTGNASGLIQTSKASIRIWDVSTATDDPSGASDGLVLSAGWDSANWGVQQYHDFHTNDLYLRSKQNGTMSSWDKVFHDTYHPNADKWTTARTHTVTLTGAVTGTASQSVDGTGNKTWSIATTQASTNYNWVLEDGDGTEVNITDGKEVKFVEGRGIDINWTDTSTGSDGDPYDLTFTGDSSKRGIARALGWVPAYGSATESNVFWDDAQEAVGLYSSSDTSIGMAFKAVRVTQGQRLRFTVPIKSSAADSDGLYVRIYYYTGDLPDGKTHVSNSALHSSVQEDTGGDTGWYENSSHTTSWRNFERTWTAPSTGYVSLVILNWSGFSGTVYAKQPDISLQDYDDLYVADQIIHTGDTDTYMQFDAANSWRVVAGGGEKLSTSTNGITITSATGNATFGSSNSSWFHMSTDRPNFYMAQGLRVNGTLGVYNQNTYLTSDDMYLNGVIYHYGDTNTYMQFHAADQWRVVVGGTERLEVKNSSPHVLVTGDLNSTSDARLKENVEPIANALSDITQLEGVSFDWKDTGTRGHGFIAQQVEPILPDVVQTDDETGIKSINYVGMIGHLVEAIKEQQTQIDALTAQVEELKRQ